MHKPVYQDQPVQETFEQLLDTSPSLLHVHLCEFMSVCVCVCVCVCGGGGGGGDVISADPGMSSLLHTWS